MSRRCSECREGYIDERGVCDSCDMEVMGLSWERLSEIEMRSIVFLDKPFYQADAFHLVTGRKGVGKGTTLADLAARVTSGELGPSRNVVWIASQDSAAIDIKPRLIAAGGEPERVIVVTDWVQLPRDIESLGHLIYELDDVGLVIIDPVGNHITGKNSNSDTDIRDAIAPLNDLADEHRTMVIGVRHLSEKEAKAGVIAAILGASAWSQVPRVVIAIARDTSEGVSVMQCVSGNRLPPETPGRAFRIDGVEIDGLENEVTRAIWIGDSTKDVEKLIGVASKEPSKSETARELILDALEAAPDMRIESDELDAMIARETGLAPQTIRNQRASLKNEGLIRSIPEKDEAGTVKRWLIERTNAIRSSGETVTGKPVTVENQKSAVFGSTTPLTVQKPRHTLTVTGQEREEPEEPETVSVGTGSGFLIAARVSASPAECLLCGFIYDENANGAESMTCPACVALRRGLVTASEAGEMRLLARLSHMESES